MIECELFSKCGGCNLYKLQDSEYKIYKEQYLKNILSEMPENIFLGMKFPNGKRRRVNLKLDYGVNLGFFKENTNDVVSLKFCPLVADEINNIILPLKQLLKTFTKRSCGEVQITLADNGLVIHFNNIHIMKNDISKIKTFAEINNIILISAGGKNIDNITDYSNIVLYEKQVPFVTFNNIQIVLPPTAFLQVSKESEMEIVDTVLREVSNLGINKKLKIIDLFCGLGLFSFYLYDMAEYITAIDCEKESILNINKTAKERQIPIIAKVQNLFSKPVSTKNLNVYDLIVYDPPRQAAINQITEIASSNVSYMIYVSCNPILFKRDAKILTKNGYKIKNITSIDQFPLTYHVETIVLLSKLDSKRHISVELPIDEMDLTSAESKATYKQIQNYVLEKFGFKVSTLYITQVKRKYGLEVREHYNISKNGNQKFPQCPSEKEEAILDVLKYFKMI